MSSRPHGRHHAHAFGKGTKNAHARGTHIGIRITIHFHHRVFSNKKKITHMPILNKFFTHRYHFILISQAQMIQNTFFYHDIEQ